MAKAKTTSAVGEDKLSIFRDNVTDKITRKAGGLVAALLGNFTDADWQKLAKECRYVANDGMKVLIVRGIEASKSKLQ